jgi:holo-[acyl-carrier protein] synthase
MYSIGIDIVEIDRITKATGRWGGAFLRRVFTDAELKLYREKPQSLAARFAGKEAVIKALGKTSGIGWKQIEILPDADGKPVVRLHGRAEEQAQNLGLERLAISLSHSRDYAVAMVVGDTE